MKNKDRNHLICVKHEEKTVKVIKMHQFLVCTYKSQDFAQSLEIFARSHYRVTVTFRNSALSTRPDFIARRQSIYAER